MAISGDEEDTKSRRIRYEIEDYTYYGDCRDDDCSFRVRRNGKLFNIRILPSKFVNSPATTKTYLSHLNLLRSGEAETDDVYDTDVYDWVMGPCESLLAKLAPDPVTTEITVTLKEWLDAEVFVLELFAVDEELHARWIESEKSPYRLPGVWLDDDEPAELKEWTAVYNSAEVVLNFDHPEDALFKTPRKVLINQGQTTCFLKECDLSRGERRAFTELEAYKKITSAHLDEKLSLCHFYGVVMDDSRRMVGLLLTYVEARPLSWVVEPSYTPARLAAMKETWTADLEATLKGLHGIGVVWGDVKPDNALLDRDGKVWVIDFGGGYTPGWVEKDLAGTVDGDLDGLAKLREYVHSEVGLGFS